MELNIKKAFLSPFSEEKWYLKLIFPTIMAAFALIYNFLSKEHKPEAIILGLLILIPGIILSGFLTQFTHNEINNKLPLLPELKTNIKKYLSYGLWTLLITLIYLFFIIVLYIIYSALFAFLIYLTKGNVYLIYILVTLSIILGIFLGFSYAFAIGSYADNLEISQIASIKKTFKLMSKAKAEIAIYLLLALALGAALGVITIILTIPRITIFLVPFFTALEQLISVNLSAQVYKIAKSRLEKPQENI